MKRLFRKVIILQFYFIFNKITNFSFNSNINFNLLTQKSTSSTICSFHQYLHRLLLLLLLLIPSVDFLVTENDKREQERENELLVMPFYSTLCECKKEEEGFFSFVLMMKKANKVEGEGWKFLRGWNFFKALKTKKFQKVSSFMKIR